MKKSIRSTILNGSSVCISTTLERLGEAVEEIIKENTGLGFVSNEHFRMRFNKNDEVIMHLNSENINKEDLILFQNAFGNHADESRLFLSVFCAGYGIEEAHIYNIHVMRDDITIVNIEEMDDYVEIYLPQNIYLQLIEKNKI